jgi:hypothetical protein
MKNKTILRLFQNFSFERATSEKGRFAGLLPAKRQSLGKTNRVLQEALFTKLKRQIMKKFFDILLSGITFEIPVTFVYHINDNGLIDEVHEYVGAKKIQRNIKYKRNE